MSHEICKQCATCCSYFSVQIDTPEEWSDFDDIIWMLAHERVSIHVEDDEWYLMVYNKCRHLENNICQIYEDRPNICREHKPGECDYNLTTEKDYDDVDHVFNTIDQLVEYRNSLYKK